MKTKLFLLTLFAALFMAACSDDDDPFEPQLPETETALLNTLSKEWQISGAQAGFKSIEFKADKTYTAVKSDNTPVSGSYTIGADLKTLTLANLGVVTLTNLTSDKLDFKLKPIGSDTEVTVSATPAPVKPVVPKTYISEVQREFKDGTYKPVVKFTYDANGRLSVAEEYDYYSDEGLSLYYTYQYTFTRNADGTVKNVSYKNKLRDGGWKDESTSTFIYQGANVVRIDLRDQDGSLDVFHYTWENGKVIKMVEEDDDENIVNFIYRNGNHIGEERTKTKEEGTVRYEHYSKVDNTYDNKHSLYLYLPFEYVLASDSDDLGRGFPMSDNNVIKSEEIDKTVKSDKSTGKTLSQYTDNYSTGYVYNFNDKGMVDSYTETSNYEYTFTDFVNPENDYSSKGSGVEKYIIKYIEVEQK